MAPASRMVDIGNGLYNLRSSFTFLMGTVDIGNHMSFIRLSNGKFLIIDTCDYNVTDAARIDEMTNNGALIEAVVATHPFHTVYFEPFHKKYPNVPFYGTPRHLRRITSIPWAGSVSQSDVLEKWASEGVLMRIPDGAEFDQPAEGNHFSTVFVFHAASKTIHIDDTLLYYDHPGCILRCFGKSHNRMEIWDLKKGLNPTASAPGDFKRFMEGIIRDWDFDNVVTAHMGNKIGGAKALVQETLNRESKLLDQLQQERSEANSKQQVGAV